MYMMSIIDICICQRTENRARKTHVFASVCSQVMKGWGGGRGMLTFLVLLPLHAKKKPVNMPQRNESKTHTKPAFCQILAREFCTIRLAEMSVSLWRKWQFLKNVVLRARFPVRRDVYAQMDQTTRPKHAYFSGRRGSRLRSNSFDGGGQVLPTGRDVVDVSRKGNKGCVLGAFLAQDQQRLR